MLGNPISNLFSSICRWATASLFCLLFITKAWGQEAPSASPYHLAIKVQAYSPLTWLAEQTHRDFSFPFTPRFWTGEVEFGLSLRRSIQASVGIMQLRLNEPWYGIRIIDNRDGLRLTLAYRDYYRSGRRGTLSGPYYSPFVRWVNATRTYDNMLGEIRSGEIEANSVSAGAFWGWQPHIGKHLYLDFGIGVELGYQWYKMTYGAQRVEVSTFDHSGTKLWRGEGDRNRSFIGFGLTSSIGAGWLLF